jgi:PadR family transcriptional regulator
MAPRASDRLLHGTLELLLLQALHRGPLHGYAIARRIKDATDDALNVEEGSLYPALYRLEELGYVTARWATTGQTRRVRLYGLTAAGRTRLAEQRKEWAAFSRAVTRMLGRA